MSTHFQNSPQEDCGMTTGRVAESGRYFVSHNGEEKGPFNLDLIEALVMSGHYPRSILLREEGSHDWQARFERVAAEPPAPPRTPAPSSKGSSAGIWIVSLIIVAVIVFVAVVESNMKSARRWPDSTSPYSNTTTATTTVLSKGDNPRGSTTSRAQSAAVSAPSTDTLVKDDQGRTYRVSNSEYRRLSLLRADLMQEEAALTALQERVKALGGELARAQTYLNRRSQASIDAYNQQVDRYNALSEEANQKLNRFNSGVDGFNSELARVGTPIR
jgi:hypothetical protein